VEGLLFILFCSTRTSRPPTIEELFQEFSLYRGEPTFPILCDRDRTV